MTMLGPLHGQVAGHRGALYMIENNRCLKKVPLSNSTELMLYKMILKHDIRKSYFKHMILKHVFK